MKKIFRNVVAAFAAVMLVSAFASCSDSDDGDDKKTEQPADKPAETPKETAVEVWSGSQKIDWGENGVVIDHAKFTADFTSIRITYNATAGALKMAVCDPWTEIAPATVSEGASIACDGAVNLATGDAETVTIKLADAAVAGIKGQGKDGAWGGVKIFGADTITITKVESVK